MELKDILGWFLGNKKKKGNTSLFEGGLHLHFHISINLVRDERKKGE